MGMDVRRRANGTSVQVPEPTGTSATDTAAIQAAIDALPAGGGTVELRAGTYVCDSGGITVGKQARIVGQGSGDIALNAATKVTCSSTTANVFTVEVDGCSFGDFAIVNTAGASPTAGAAIRFEAATFSRVDSMVISGFYENIRYIAGMYPTVTDCVFLDPVLYGVHLANADDGDHGDHVFTGNLFTVYATTRTPSAAVRWTSGGGMKFVANKINGGSQQPGAHASCGKFAHGLDFNVADAVSTSVMTVAGNSIENCTSYCVAINKSGTGSFKQVSITGNEIAIGGTGIYLVAGQHFVVSGNVFNFLTTGIRVGASASSVSLGLNNYGATTTPAQLDAGCSGVAISSPLAFTTAGRPTVSQVTNGSTYYDTTLGRILHSNGTAWVDPTAVYAPAASATTKAQVKSRTSGNITVNGTSWANLDTNLDLVLTGLTAGQYVEVGVSARWGNEAVFGFLHCATLVGSTITNYLAGGGGSSDTGVQGWFGPSGVQVPIGGSIIYPVVSGDLESGQLTLRWRTRTFTAANKTLYASSSDPLVVWARVIG